MRVWVRPLALYWEGRLHREVYVALSEGRPVEITCELVPEAHLLPGILSPAWVNAHTHLELSHWEGRLAPGMGMVAFLEAMGAGRGRAPAETIYRALSEACQEGTTAFVSHQNTPLMPEAIPPGVVVKPLWEYFGLHPRLRRTRYYQARKSGYSLTPHSLYALSRGLHRIARRPSAFPKSVHFYESWEERLWLQEGRGPFARFFRNFYRRPYRPPLRKALHRLARRTPALWLVHVCEAPVQALFQWLSEIPNLYLVLCPLANWYLFRRRPPLSALRGWAHRLLLGTDSLANAPTLSLWPTVRHLHQSGWPWEAILQAAVDNPRQWISPLPGWTLISPLTENLSILPHTRATKWNTYSQYC